MEDKSFRRENFSREIDLLLNPEDPEMEFLNFPSLIEFQGGKFRLDTNIHESKTRVSFMDNYG